MITFRDANKVRRAAVEAGSHVQVVLEARENWPGTDNPWKLHDFGPKATTTRILRWVDEQSGLAPGGARSVEVRLPEACDCARFPAMHDLAGVCNNWQRHGGQRCAHFVLGDGRTFATEDAAKLAAGAVFDATRVVLSVVAR